MRMCGAGAPSLHLRWYGEADFRCIFTVPAPILLHSINCGMVNFMRIYGAGAHAASSARLRKSRFSAYLRCRRAWYFLRCGTEALAYCVCTVFAARLWWPKCHRKGALGVHDTTCGGQCKPISCVFTAFSPRSVSHMRSQKLF